MTRELKPGRSSHYDHFVTIIFDTYMTAMMTDVTNRARKERPEQGSGNEFDDISSFDGGGHRVLKYGSTYAQHIISAVARRLLCSSAGPCHLQIVRNGQVPCIKIENMGMCPVTAVQDIFEV